MSTYTAAYCSACGAYVLLSVQGDCVYGHPRSSLRGIYQAEIDKRTGYPKPPSAEQRAASLRHSTPPVAPIALPVDIAPGPAIALDRQFDADWPVKADARPPHRSRRRRRRARCHSIQSSRRWARACPRRSCSRTSTVSSGGCSVRRVGDTPRAWPRSGRRKASTRPSRKPRQGQQELNGVFITGSGFAATFAVQQVRRPATLGGRSIVVTCAE